jgi:hypothetical protein
MLSAPDEERLVGAVGVRVRDVVQPHREAQSPAPARLGVRRAMAGQDAETRHRIG